METAGGNQGYFMILWWKKSEKCYLTSLSVVSLFTNDYLIWLKFVFEFFKTNHFLLILTTDKVWSNFDHRQIFYLLNSHILFYSGYWSCFSETWDTLYFNLNVDSNLIATTIYFLTTALGLKMEISTKKPKQKQKTKLKLHSFPLSNSRLHFYITIIFQEFSYNIDTMVGTCLRKHLKQFDIASNLTGRKRVS